MKKILLTIVTCLQNKQRLINQIKNLNAYILPENIRVCFCFGNNYDGRYSELLKGFDTVVVDIEDQYLNRSLKTKKIFEEVYNKFNFDFVIKIDDDTVINIDLIKNLDFSFDYIGRFQKCDIDSFIQLHLFKFNVFEKINAFSRIFDRPFSFASGDFYVLSRQAVEKINAYTLPTLRKEDLIFLNEDQMIGYILCDKNFKILDINHKNNLIFKNDLQVTLNGLSIHPIAESLFEHLIKKPLEEQLNIIDKNTLKNLTSRKIYTHSLKENILNTIVEFLNKHKTIGLG